MGAARTLLKKTVFDGKMNETVLSSFADCHYRLGSILEAVDIYRLMIERGIGADMAGCSSREFMASGRRGPVWQKPSPSQGQGPPICSFSIAQRATPRVFDGKAGSAPTCRRKHRSGGSGEYPSTAPRGCRRVLDLVRPDCGDGIEHDPGLHDLAGFLHGAENIQRKGFSSAVLFQEVCSAKKKTC